VLRTAESQTLPYLQANKSAYCRFLDAGRQQETTSKGQNIPSLRAQQGAEALADLHELLLPPGPKGIACGYTQRPPVTQ
jgi:hypothetical protein